MNDIFSDTIFTAPTREPQRVVTGFIAYTEADEAEMGRRMMEAVASERKAPTAVNYCNKADGHPLVGRNSRALGAEFERQLLETLAQNGPLTTAEAAELLGRDRTSIAARLSRMFDAKKVRRTKLMGVSRGWVYHAIPQTAQAAASRSTAKNVGVSFAARGEA